MDESDLRVRLAAFAFLDEQRKRSPDLFERRTRNERGFGRRNALMDWGNSRIPAPLLVATPKARKAAWNCEARSKNRTFPWLH